MGVLTEDDTQLVFTDTPGFHKPKTKLGEKMIKAVDDSIGGVDSCLFVTESRGEIRPTELELLQKLRNEKIPVVLAINKIDMISDKQELMSRILELTKLLDFDAVVPVSAKSGDGMQELKAELVKLAIPSEFFFPEDTLTDQPERVLAAEMIREKLLHRLNEEIPHGIAVSIEKMRERDDKDIIDIDAVIYCERESHKGIIIGKKGAMLKEVSTNARHELENFFECKVNLQCWVKVKEDWRNRQGLLGSFGYKL
jgi:GTP-binding protein Era